MLRSLAILGALALISCSPHWQGERVLGVEVVWPEDGPRPVRRFARAVYEASLASPDPRLLDGARVVIVATQQELQGWCLQPTVRGCWHPDYDDEDGAGTIYIGPAGTGDTIAEAVIRHELGHLARWRWRGDSDAEHSDGEWWIKYDTTPVRCE